MHIVFDEYYFFNFFNVLLQWKEKSAETKTEPETIKPENKNKKPLKQTEIEEEKITEKQEEKKLEEKEEGELNKEGEVATDSSTADSEIGNSY